MPKNASDVTAELLTWVQAAAPGVPAAVGAAGAPPTDGIDIRLLAISPRPSPRSPTPPAVLMLDYLVAVRRKDGLEEHRIAGELMFAALDREELEVLADLSPTESAARLGLPPAAGFVVRTNLVREREAVKHPLVRFPLVARMGGLHRVEGVVLGPGDVPVAGAVVTLVGLGHTARTAADGRFRMAGPLPDTAEVRVKARAKGVEAEVTAAAGKPTVLHLPLEI